VQLQKNKKLPFFSPTWLITYLIERLFCDFKSNWEKTKFLQVGIICFFNQLGKKIELQKNVGLVSCNLLKFLNMCPFMLCVKKRNLAC